jgi:DNA repair protein REV1
MGSRLENNSRSVRKRIEKHSFEDEHGDEYEGSSFGGFTDYFRRKKIKLQNLDADLRSRAEGKPQIFKGIVANVNGYTQPSLNDLHTLIVQHGGGFMQYLDGKTTVTHIIASNLTPKKAIEFKRYRVVKPAWVVDSIKAGRLLPWNEYRVVDEGEKQKVLAFDNGKVLSEASVKKRGYKDQTDASWYTSQLRGSQAGTQEDIPSNALRSRYSKYKLSTPNDNGIDKDYLPSHQPEPASLEPSAFESERMVTSLMTSPSRVSREHSAREEIELDQGDILYAQPTPPNAPLALTPPPLPVTDNGTPQLIRDLKKLAPELKSPSKKPLTAEEHNAILLRDPKTRKSTVVDPNFLEQYYRESRLHHLSTWKADLKSQLQAMANEQTSSQKLKQKRPPSARRYILHVDFDSFFAAVSLKKNPQWKDKPAVVAHGDGTGSEIASCNYPARAYGVKNGMWMKRALELCPHLKILPYDFPAYEEASRAFYDVILSTGGVVQSVSVDEALVDISLLCIATGGSDGKHMSESSIYREQAKAEEMAQSLRDEVKQRTGCNVSVGVGGNILLAKVALRKAKPAGQYQIKPEEVLDFIGQLQVQDLPGVAWSISGKLEQLGIKFVKDIREFTKERLIQFLGPKTGEKLWEYSRGIDKIEIGEQVIRKSVSAEVNWGVRFENQEQVDEFIRSLCGELQKRLLKEKVKGKQFTMKVMRRSPDAPLDPPKHLGHGKCDTYNKSLVLGVATNSKEILTKEALGILRGFGFSPGELRGIGLQMTKLDPLKSATDGNLESSQRRLQFKVSNADAAPASVRKSSTKAPPVVDADPIQDDPETPKKNKAAAASDQISFGAHQLNKSTPSRRPLNTLGTQFILPSQADPKVLAELPEDIRSKLLRQARQGSPTPAPRNHSSRENSPFAVKNPPFALTALPAHSQLDPDTLAALPVDVRAEILSQYHATGLPPQSPIHSPHRRHPHADQTILPQSPRKTRIIGIPAKKSIVPIKRGRGRPPKSAQLAAAALATAKTKSGRLLMQANFITRNNPARGSRETSVDVGADDLDSEFLAALPEEIRREVIEEHKRKKLQAARLALTRQQRLNPPPVQPVKRPLTIKVPRPQKPSFTTQKLSKEKDLRGAIKQWVREFADEGPYEEDAGALASYLKRVVLGERNLGKAVGVVKWMAWVVDEMMDEEGENGADDEGGRRGEWDKWRDAVGMVEEGVRDAARKRGLGRVAFD